MTAAQQMRSAGFAASLRVRGRAAVTDADERVTILVDDTQPFPDPTNEAKAETPIFAHVSIKAGAVASPREVAFFVESGAGGRSYKVFRYLEAAADGVSWKFECEAQRLNRVQP